ncbi:hypothetical protein EZV62_019127 [Acer yangbiense]|uniref:DUF4283 domain-containing protein n=1 Tax=Acer yangbiense TaxID=1000413 RepID=A0A5C7HAD6_9ROSI|nr:hypothetical protein EZV62_019127 [Acer yangbiense]
MGVRKAPEVFRTYAKAVRESHSSGDDVQKEEKEKSLSTCWDFSKNDQVWLNKCAIGILKDFKDVSKVNDRLDSYGCEPLLVDKRTEERVLLDKGRLLVLLPQHLPTAKSVKIFGGKKPFSVKVEEEGSSIDMDWLENFLGLRKNQDQDRRKSMLEKEKFQICWPKEVGESRLAGKSMGLFLKKYADKGKNKCNSTGVIIGIESEPARGGSSLDSLATKEASVQAAIEVESLVQSLREGDQEESEEVEVISSDIQVLKEERVWATLEEAEKEVDFVSAAGSRCPGQRVVAEKEERVREEELFVSVVAWAWCGCGLCGLASPFWFLCVLGSCLVGVFVVWVVCSEDSVVIQVYIDTIIMIKTFTYNSLFLKLFKNECVFLGCLLECSLSREIGVEVVGPSSSGSLLNERSDVLRSIRFSILKGFVGEKVNREAFIRVIEQLWSQFGQVDIEAVAENTLFSYFNNLENHDAVWVRGPWHFHNNLIDLEKPKGARDISKLAFDKVEMWIQVHNLPLMCMNRRAAKLITEQINPVVEIPTESRDCRGRLPEFCYACGKLGNVLRECADDEARLEALKGSSTKFGSWMRAPIKERLKIKNQRKKDSNSSDTMEGKCILTSDGFTKGAEGLKKIHNSLHFIDREDSRGLVGS